MAFQTLLKFHAFPEELELCAQGWTGHACIWV